LIDEPIRQWPPMTAQSQSKNRKAVKALVDVIDQSRNLFEKLSENHGTGIACSPQSMDTMNAWGHRSMVQNSLEGIRLDLGECRRCKLHANRKKLVFGAGASNARLVFVGEGPGYDEDLQGEPFVGKAGQLLTRIIEAMGLTRNEVYICNIIKCRPPKNRNPEPDEIESCLPFLKRQLKTIQPEFICALGNFAARTLLETDVPISRLRGKFHHYMGIRVLPTFHPAYLLRNPGKKRDVWEDIKKLMDQMGLQVPNRS